MVEFTGERVVPGAVDADLWNEHFSRYLFGRTLCTGRTVLDIGCGAGYGVATLSSHARSVVGIDIASDAVAHARANYTSSNSSFLQASATKLPFTEQSFEVITAFEVIEHLEDWPALLTEASRVLTGDGVFLVSTPNRDYYTETRRASGPNPFHVHEFDLQEFRHSLSQTFLSVCVLGQNHTSAVVLRPAAAPSSGRAEFVAPETLENSHFYLAICSRAPLQNPSPFAFVPQSGNVLRDREQHIGKLEAELAQKMDWLRKSQQELQALLAIHEEAVQELKGRAEWAHDQEARIHALQTRVVQLQEDQAREQADAAHAIEELEAENQRKTQWSLDLTAEIAGVRQELARTLEALHNLEREFDDRTRWALDLDANRAQLEARLSEYASSRWVKAGAKFGLGPLGRER